MTLNTILQWEEHKIGEKHLSIFDYLTSCTVSILLKQALHRSSFDALGSESNDSTDNTNNKTKCDTALPGYIYGFILSFPMPHSFA